MRFCPSWCTVNQVHSQPGGSWTGGAWAAARISPRVWSGLPVARCAVLRIAPTSKFKAAVALRRCPSRRSAGCEDRGVCARMVRVWMQHDHPALQSGGPELSAPAAAPLSTTRPGCVARPLRQRRIRLCRGGVGVRAGIRRTRPEPVSHPCMPDRLSLSACQIWIGRALQGEPQGQPFRTRGTTDAPCVNEAQCLVLLSYRIGSFVWKLVWKLVWRGPACGVCYKGAGQASLTAMRTVRRPPHEDRAWTGQAGRHPAGGGLGSDADSLPATAGAAGHMYIRRCSAALLRDRGSRLG